MVVVVEIFLDEEDDDDGRAMGDKDSVYSEMASMSEEKAGGGFQLMVIVRQQDRTNSYGRELLLAAVIEGMTGVPPVCDVTLPNSSSRSSRC